MSQYLVIHLAKISQGTRQASAQIAKMLAEKIGCQIMDRVDSGLVGSYDTVFIVNSPSAFCSFIDDIVETCKISGRLIWIMNDLTIYPPTQLRNYLYESGRKLEMWGTLPSIPSIWQDRKSYGNLPRKANQVLNWNALSFNPIEKREPSQEGLVYWGAYRVMPSHSTDRYHDFKRYLFNPLYPTTISTSVRSIPKWEERIVNKELVTLIGPFENLTYDIQSWPATIYIEDQLSHAVFCQLPNRFYEALSAGIALLVDAAASKTIEKAGLTCQSEWIVRNREEVFDVLPHAKSIAQKQAEEWGQTDYRAELVHNIDEVFYQEGIR